MPAYLTTGCGLACTFGASPSVFVATELPGKPVVLGGLTTATVAEVVPVENVPPFGLCTSMANPEVAAATVAAWTSRTIRWGAG